MYLLISRMVFLAFIVFAVKWLFQLSFLLNKRPKYLTSCLGFIIWPEQCNSKSSGILCVLENRITSVLLWASGNILLWLQLLKIVYACSILLFALWMLDSVEKRRISSAKAIMLTFSGYLQLKPSSKARFYSVGDNTLPCGQPLRHNLLYLMPLDSRFTLWSFKKLAIIFIR